jgi:D-alanyl-D-alanine carboxypeptidase/D-alanyl-D-alanine-endopeptidase (penicillin-binding protein 4)
MGRDRHAVTLTARGQAVCALLGATLVIGGCLSLRTSLTVDPAAADPIQGRLAHRRQAHSLQASTPLWSPRRVPEFWGAAVADGNLARKLRTVITGTSACVVVEAGGNVIARIDPFRLLAPASTMKVLTALTVLRWRGPDFTFSTQLRGAAADTDGAITGDLHLIGGGDPTLSTPRYEEYVRGSPRLRDDPLTPLQGMVDALVAEGVTRIDGAVVGHGDRYSGPAYLETWKPSYRAEGQVGPIGALTVNHGFADFPPPVPIDDPARAAAEQLTILLERTGTAVGNEARSDPGPAPATDGDVVHATITSPRLDAIVAGMLTSSDNTTAEMLLREAALAAGRTATTDGGIAVVLDTLTEAQIRTADIAPLDGSGLSADSRLSCATLIDAVAEADAAIDSGFADAGETGTLALRFIGHPLAGRLHAKTGQLDGVVGFVGILDPQARRPEVRFAFLANGDFSTEGGQALQQAVAEALATYPDAPAASDLVPEPE